uniref:Uncharacterized protein n=2 Tax=Meloidogyne TaxID=189290 RepID=A0A915LMK7_MELJA
MSGMCQEELNLFQTENDKGFGKILDDHVRNEFGMAFRKYEEKRDIKVWINTIKVLLREFEYEENDGECLTVLDSSHSNKQKTDKRQLKRLENILIEEFQEVEKANGKILVAFEDNDIEELDNGENDERSEGNDERIKGNGERSEGIDERSEGNEERSEGNNERNEGDEWKDVGNERRLGMNERKTRIEGDNETDDRIESNDERSEERDEVNSERKLRHDEMNKGIAQRNERNKCKEGKNERNKKDKYLNDHQNERDNGNNKKNKGKIIRNEWNKEGKFQKILQLVSIEMACIERELKESFKDLDDSSPLKGHKKLERSETQKKREIEEDELNKLYVIKRKIEINVDNGKLNKVFDKLKGGYKDETQEFFSCPFENWFVALVLPPFFCST